MSDKSDIVFSHDEFEKLVKRFATEMPKHLLRHQSTAHLAFDLERLRLIESMDMRFTVAIIGQMRVGKSTLLNALIGKDLAPTGVTETTATINWFRHAQGDLCNKFRVHWTDGSTTDMPLDRVNEWIGLEKNAERTRRLEFFADTDFLRRSNVVDTPGTRSVIPTHEDATQGFLADKLESESLRYGGSADAVIYAINPVGRESDNELLKLFGQRSRLPGASAYNSIAVVQKWEHLQPDPFEEAQKKCKLLRSQLEGKVAAVVPTSGLLARHAAEVPVSVWQVLADFSMNVTVSALDTLLLSEQDFGDDIPASPLDQKGRRELLSTISWKILPLCISIARRNAISDGETLRRHVLEASGVPGLFKLLETLFFSRARLIKASTILRKAWEPCEVALLTLRKELTEQSATMAQGHEAQSRIASLGEADPSLRKAGQFVANSIKVIERSLAMLSDIQGHVDALKYSVMKNFDLFDSDIESLKLLEELRSSFPRDHAAELDRLFGQSGPDLWPRLGYSGKPADSDEALANAKKRFSFWSLQKQKSVGKKENVCAHACHVLEHILDHLEGGLHV